MDIAIRISVERRISCRFSDDTISRKQNAQQEEIRIGKLNFVFSFHYIQAEIQRKYIVYYNVAAAFLETIVATDSNQTWKEC